MIDASAKLFKTWMLFGRIFSQISRGWLIIVESVPNSCFVAQNLETVDKTMSSSSHHIQWENYFWCRKIFKLLAFCEGTCHIHVLAYIDGFQIRQHLNLRIWQFWAGLLNKIKCIFSSWKVLLAMAAEL